MDVQTQLFTHPARVLTAGPLDSERLLALVREQHAFDASVLDERTPFFWPAEISSNRLDAYYTRMAPSSLRNYAAEAAAGVSFQNSHAVDKLGFGRSLTGAYSEEGELARVLAEFYTIPGLRLHDVSTDDFILGVRAGLIRDVSIGFYNCTFRCSICGRSIWDYECPHIPGVKYAKRNDLGETVGEELAFAWVDDAHLAEVSAVYDGATPGAAILKAQQEADGGRLRPEVAQLLEARYRGLRLMRQAWPGSGAGGRGGEPVDLEKLIADVRGALGVAADADLVAAVRLANDEAKRLQAEVARLQTCEQRATEGAQRIAELSPLAEDGRQYRADLVAAALAEGVRALGNQFAPDTYRAILDAAPLETIKRMRDDWRVVGDQVLPGGRLTRDHAPATNSKPVETPDAAYRS